MTERTPPQEEMASPSASTLAADALAAAQAEHADARRQELAAIETYRDACRPLAARHIPIGPHDWPTLTAAAALDQSRSAMLAAIHRATSAESALARARATARYEGLEPDRTPPPTAQASRPHSPSPLDELISAAQTYADAISADKHAAEAFTESVIIAAQTLAAEGVPQ